MAIRDAQQWQQLKWLGVKLEYQKLLEARQIDYKDENCPLHFNFTYNRFSMGWMVR